MMRHPGQDTAPLKAEQLSEHEILVINEIEERMSVDLGRPTKPTFRDRRDISVPILQRAPRVLLLDGGRGTGKTSVLLTMMKRWREEWPALGKLQKSPEDLFVLANIDFDPLPPGMPLLGGLVQAWKPLVEAIEDASPECDDEKLTLSDRWHSLFRMAVSGWSDIQGSDGIVEQVLAREEQVQDWQKFSEKWCEFVNMAACEAVKQADELKIPESLKFVIIVDDCDLQVGRIRDLLPALRNLYHQRVFFLVAADKPHMMDMLKLDFLGEQVRISSDGRGSSIATAEVDREAWAKQLAYSTFEKVFTRGNQWKLDRLSLREFLAYPGKPSVTQPEGLSFYCALKSLKLTGSDEKQAVQIKGKGGTSKIAKSISRGRDRAASSHVGDLLWDFATEAHDLGLPSVMSYRAVQQLYDQVFDADSDGVVKPRDGAGLDILAALFSDRSEESAAVVRNDRTVDVSFTGEVASLFRPKAVEFSRYSVVFGTRPDFSFLPYGGKLPKRQSQSTDAINWTALLAAKTVEVAKGPVDAAGIRWENRLSLAWTEWQRPSASFLWTFHRHARPDELLKQAKQWANCLAILGPVADDLGSKGLDRFAYAWVYHQIIWNNDNKELSENLKPKASDELPWDDLLKEMPVKSIGDWKNITLPLLARPEIGFSPGVQKHLLFLCEASQKRILKQMRRRMVRDAVVALAIDRGREVPDLPSADDVEGFINEMETDYRASNDGNHSPWFEQVEKFEPQQEVSA